jgi:cytochrome c peroxidase
MDADLGDLMSVGILAILVAGSAVTLLVRFDLVPASHAPERWFIAAGLGLGVIAFSIKLAIVATVSRLPDQVVSPLIANVGREPVGDDPYEMPAVEPLRHAWRALPVEAPAPSNNPTTPEKVALGRRLFFDPALSRDGHFSCASCHDVAKAGGDGRATAVGISAVPGKRNSPTVYNAAFQAVLFWDGRAASLEEQAKGPLVNPDEMGMPSWQAVEQRVMGEASYRRAFDAAFGDGAPISIDQIAQAIAAYERTLITPDTPYDRFVRGDMLALSEQQRRGMALFQVTGCIACHSGPNFSGASLVADRSPYRLFPANRSEYAERYRLTDDTGKAGAGADRGLWRVPSLRNVALTAPYFHNGAVSDLSEAVRIMAAVQANAVIDNDPRLRRIGDWSAADGTLAVYDRRVITDQDVADLVAFLNALSSPMLVAAMGGNGQ